MEMDFRAWLASRKKKAYFCPRGHAEKDECRLNKGEMQHACGDGILCLWLAVGASVFSR